MKRQVHLNLFIHSRGHHEAAWRHPSASPFLLTDFRYYKDLALKAENAFFDSIFLSDILALGSDIEHTPRAVLDPIPLMGSLAAITSKIGVIGTASTTYVEPYNLARQFASLDHLSNGRVAWNIVTTSSAEAATRASDSRVGPGRGFCSSSDSRSSTQKLHIIFYVGPTQSPTLM